MISCKLQGGLCNQMFQIAAAHALALRNNDVSGFNIDVCYTPQQGNPANYYKNNIFKNIKDVKGYPFKNYYNETGFAYREIPYNADLLLNGSFQSDKFFKDFKNEIINLFHLDPNHINLIKKVIGFGSRPYTAVHVRRGDYLNNPSFHQPCDIQYFNRAMEIIGESNFIFLSDDMDWVKTNFSGNNIIYSPFTDDLSDFLLMTICDNNIIANSSFSWWGAYLNSTPDNKVIAPIQWFGPSGHQDTQDVIPENWLKI